MNPLTLCNGCDAAEATTPAGYCSYCDPDAPVTVTITQRQASNLRTASYLAHTGDWPIEERKVLREAAIAIHKAQDAARKDTL